MNSWVEESIHLHDIPAGPDEAGDESHFDRARKHRCTMSNPIFAEASAKRLSNEAAARFSYSTADQTLARRSIIRTIEFLGGQRRLYRLYERRNTALNPGETFFDAAIRLLDLEIDLRDEDLAKIPKSGPLLLLANHPYGVLDGLVLTWLVLRVRRDISVLANGVLTHVPEAREFLLPVDFSGSEAAKQVNLTSRRVALDRLCQGHAVGLFPGGGVSTSERPLSRPALDLPWAPFTAKLVHQSRATVIPVHFSGQNSRLFQIASHLSETLRLSLLFRETARRIGTSLHVRVGDPISHSVLAGFHNRADLVWELRRRTYALAPDDIDWMRHGRIRQPTA